VNHRGRISRRIGVVQCTSGPTVNDVMKYIEGG
jgi:hypothetical protein